MVCARSGEEDETGIVMAKSSTSAASATPQTVEQPTTTNLVPEDLMARTKADVGRAVSFKPEDQLIPLIYVLQTNSPIVDRRAASYIEEAEPGHFWLRGAIQPIKDGEEGIEVIPCGMQHTWIEWLPQRQGFVTRHPEMPKDTETRSVRGDDGRERQTLVRRGNGNYLQDTREFFILVNGFPYVLPCTGTKHSFARAWQSYYHQFRHPETNGVMPAFSRKYRLVTVPQSNAQGKWFGIKFEDLGWVSLAEYNAASAFNESVEKGEKKAEAPMAGGDEPAPSGPDRTDTREDIPF
jgi:hypothetical protein